MVINFAHQKGGVGKSTLSTNLAVALEAIIIDLDSQKSSVLWNRIRKVNNREPLEVIAVANEQEMKEVLLSNKNKNIVIDSGGYDSALTRLAIISADVLLTPVSPSQIEIFGLQSFEKILRQISDQTGKTVQTNVIINNADSRSKSSIAELQEYITQNENFNLLDSLIHNFSDFKKAYAQGCSVIELNQKSKAAAEIEALAKEIIE